jgi:hypothetical protein
MALTYFFVSLFPILIFELIKYKERQRSVTSDKGQKKTLTRSDSNMFCDNTQQGVTFSLSFFNAKNSICSSTYCFPTVR